MALVNCVECNHLVSKIAASCPQCGAPYPQSRPKPRTWQDNLKDIVITIALIAVGIWFAGFLYANKMIG